MFHLTHPYQKSKLGISIFHPKHLEECSCDGLGGNNDILCPLHCQANYSIN